MHRRVNDTLVHYVERGAGVPLVALHGAGVDHREIEAALEAIISTSAYRRFYPDLPGTGHSTTDGLTGNDDVVRLVVNLLEVLADEPVLLLGHSYGAYVARGVAARRPDLIRGLALICPVGAGGQDLPQHHVVYEDAAAYDELEPDQRAGFEEYFVVRTPTTARRYRDYVAPAAALLDQAGLERIFSNWTIDVGSAAFLNPTLIVAGRHDSVVGYVDATRLVERYPRATLAVLEDAGHALMHERPEMLAALIADWLSRASRAGA